MTDCPCGSGLLPTLVYDARGIELGFMCERCRKRRLASYRPEVLIDPNYEHEEPLDDC